MQYATFKGNRRQGARPSLTVGKPYEVIDQDHRGILIANDKCSRKWYNPEDFVIEGEPVLFYRWVDATKEIPDRGMYYCRHTGTAPVFIMSCDEIRAFVEHHKIEYLKQV